jgi:hypothetical protein
LEDLLAGGFEDSADRIHAVVELREGVEGGGSA